MKYRPLEKIGIHDSMQINKQINGDEKRTLTSNIRLNADW